MRQTDGGKVMETLVKSIGFILAGGSVMKLELEKPSLTGSDIFSIVVGGILVFAGIIYAIDIFPNNYVSRMRSKIKNGRILEILSIMLSSILFGITFAQVMLLFPVGKTSTIIEIIIVSIILVAILIISRKIMILPQNMIAIGMVVIVYSTILLWISSTSSLTIKLMLTFGCLLVFAGAVRIKIVISPIEKTTSPTK